MGTGSIHDDMTIIQLIISPLVRYFRNLEDAHMYK
jgi:hypothetical protein